MAENWSLVVNGQPKPWPQQNYLEEDITIDLNWGIDTNTHMSTPITFNVSQVISGHKVDGVSVDHENHLIVCNIPIIERTKNYKIIVNWSQIKNGVKNDLAVSINGKRVEVVDNAIILKGKEITTPVEFRYHGSKCEYSIDNNLIHVDLPYHINSSAQSPKTIFKPIHGVIMLGIGILFFALGFMLGRDSTEDTIVVQEDDVVVEKQEQQIEAPELCRDYQKLGELLQYDVWREQDFKDAGFEDLYNAVKSYEYNTITQINDDLRAQNPAIGVNDKFGTYFTWSKVCNMAKSATKQAPHNHIEFNNGEINLKEWLEGEKRGVNKQVDQTPSTPSQSVTPPTKRATAQKNNNSKRT